MVPQALFCTLELFLRLLHLQRQVANLVCPLTFEAQLGDEQYLLYSASNWEALGNLEDSRHRQPGTDPVVGVTRHSGNIMGKENASFPCSPFKHLGVACTGKLHVLVRGRSPLEGCGVLRHARCRYRDPRPLPGARSSRVSPISAGERPAAPGVSRAPPRAGNAARFGAVPPQTSLAGRAGRLGPLFGVSDSR